VTFCTFEDVARPQIFSIVVLLVIAALDGGAENPRTASIASKYA